MVADVFKTQYPGTFQVWNFSGNESRREWFLRFVTVEVLNTMKGVLSFFLVFSEGFSGFYFLFSFFLSLCGSDRLCMFAGKCCFALYVMYFTLVFAN